MFYYSQNSKNIVSILFHNFVEFAILLYTFLVISVAQYREYIICLISFSEFSDVLHAFTSASALDLAADSKIEYNIYKSQSFFLFSQKKLNIFYYTYLNFFF